MQIVEVNSPSLAQKFLHFPIAFYDGDPNYIRPLDTDVESVFDPAKNKFFRHGSCKRWILMGNEGNPVGRIAAFINRKTVKSFDQPTGGMGFFECINNQMAAFRLFDTARDWLREQGMEAMDGPINFGDRDRWWGLLVDGFHPPCYCCNYNPPYYRDLFEQYGFNVYFKQFTYYRDVQEQLETRYSTRAEAIMNNPDYSFEHLTKGKLDKYTDDFRTIYNKAWARHKGVGEMAQQHARQIIGKLKPVIDEHIAWFAYFKNEPVGFFLSIPELNQLFVKDVNGKLDLSGKLRLLWNKWTGRCKTMYGIAFGIVPEHQRKGVETAMIVSAANFIQNNPRVQYQNLQMNWIGDFNPKMMNVAEHIGGKIYKTHHTYRYLFDRTKEFKRHPIL
ncbi:MAG TPA: hypothetical protein VGE26_08620 [Sphingobacteriaceae bacterium]